MFNLIRKLSLPIVIIIVVIVLIFLPEIIGIKSKTTTSKSSSSNWKESFKPKPSYDSSKTSSSVIKGTSDSNYSTKIISWEFIKSKRNKKELKKAYKNSKRLYSKIDPIYKTTKENLANYIKSVENLINQKDPSVNPIKIAKEIEKNDLDTSVAMINEFVPRGFLVEWSKIDLSYTCQSSRGHNYKVIAASYFDPKFQILDMDFYLRKDKHEFTLSNIDYIDINFALLGDTVKRIVLYRNGKKEKSLSVRDDLLSKVWNRVPLKLKDLNGIYSIQIEDKYGATYIKSYKFNRAFNDIRTTFNPTRKNRSVDRYTSSLKGNYINNHNMLDSNFYYGSNLSEEISIAGIEKF